MPLDPTDPTIFTNHPTFRAVIDRIIPAAAGYPPASVNGVPEYLWYQLRPGGDLAHLLTIYTLWLEALQREADVLVDERFEKMKPEEQDALLHAVEIGRTHAAWPLDGAAVFAALVNHVAEGYYADPEHNPGANPMKVSWRMIGFEERTGLPPNGEAAP